MYSDSFKFFSLFPTQNELPQVIIGMYRVIYHIGALSVVIRTTS